MRPGRLDAGKMWTFDTPPLDYFQEAYGFRPDSAWLARARLGALRFATYCSASFVSPHGLVLTNRSEEHTSELQSRPHLVCRLLLEKKKKKLIILFTVTYGSK